MVGTVWASGFVLFCKHSTVTDHPALIQLSVQTTPDIVYLPDASYPLTAGVGAFNASLVQPFLKAAGNGVPYGLYSYLYNGVVNTELVIQGQPISCLNQSACNSYLLPGCLDGCSPWPPGGWPESPVVAIWNAPAVQYEFLNSIDSSDGFQQSDCDVIGGGQEYILAVQVCIAESNAYPGSIIISKAFSQHIKICSHLTP